MEFRCMHLPLLLLFHISIVSSSSVCPHSDSDLFFVDDFRSQCSRFIERSSPLEITGDTLVKELTTAPKSAYFSILFHSTLCPFSNNFKPNFDSLCSMFPNIKHLTIEESSVMPSVLSRYRIRSFPAILLANGTDLVHYYGLKDLKSLVNFYREITGLEPISYIIIDQPESNKNPRSFMETLKEEPYVALGVAFIFLKAIIRIAPVLFSCIKSFFLSYITNIRIGEPGQLLERFLQIVNFNKIWSKIRVLNQTRNIQKGVSNARGWASKGGFCI